MRGSYFQVLYSDFNAEFCYLIPDSPFFLQLSISVFKSDMRISRSWPQAKMKQGMQINKQEKQLCTVSKCMHASATNRPTRVFRSTASRRHSALNILLNS
jgi:hypothetical protein